MRALGLIVFQPILCVTACGQIASSVAVEVRTGSGPGASFPVDFSGHSTSLTIPNPKRQPNWREPDFGKPYVEALRVKAREIDARTVDVELSVLLNSAPESHRQGGFTPAGLEEEAIGHSSLMLGEESSFSEIARYGLLPVTVRIVSNLPETARATPITDETGILAVEAVNELRNDVLLTLRNTSAKPIVAVNIVVMANGMEFSGQTRNIPKGRILISAGGVWRESINIMQPRADGLVMPVHVFLKAVLFADDTWAGEAATAARILGTRFGEALQNKRILDQLHAVLAKGVAHDDDMVTEFEQRITSLPSDSTGSELLDALGRTSFAEAEEQKAFGDGFLFGQKAALGAVRNDLTEFKRKRAAAITQSFTTFWLDRESKYAQDAGSPPIQ